VSEFRERLLEIIQACGLTWEAAENCLKVLVIKVVYGDEDDKTFAHPTTDAELVLMQLLTDTQLYQRMNAHLLPEGGFVHHDPQGKLDTAAYGKRIKETVKLLKLIWGKGPNGPSSALDGGDDDDPDDAANPAMDGGESPTLPTPTYRANVFGGDNDA